MAVVIAVKVNGTLIDVPTPPMAIVPVYSSSGRFDGGVSSTVTVVEAPGASEAIVAGDAKVMYVVDGRETPKRAAGRTAVIDDRERDERLTADHHAGIEITRVRRQHGLERVNRNANQQVEHGPLSRREGDRDDAGGPLGRRIVERVAERRRAVAGDLVRRRSVARSCRRVPRCRWRSGR